MDDYQNEAKDLNVVACVHVQHSSEQPKTLYETVRADMQANENPRGLPNAIVCYCDFDKGPEFVEQQIQTHLKLSSRVRGVRVSHGYTSKFFFTPNPNLLSDENFRKSFALLEQYDLTFDTYGYAYQIRDVTDLAKAFPNTTIILNHFGVPYGVDNDTANTRNSKELKTISPERAEQEIQAWRTDLQELSELPNVYLKISGLAMIFNLAIRDYYDRRLSGVEALTDAFYPYVEHGLQCFGADRSMWASNFPVDRQLVSFNENYLAYKACFDRYGLSDEDQHKIFFANAVEIYRIQFDKAKFSSEVAAMIPEKYFSNQYVDVYGKQSKKRCHNPKCGKMESRCKQLQKCAKCMKALYCSKDCQQIDWPQHKFGCK